MFITYTYFRSWVSLTPYVYNSKSYFRPFCLLLFENALFHFFFYHISQGSEVSDYELHARSQSLPGVAKASEGGVASQSVNSSQSRDQKKVTC